MMILRQYHIFELDTINIYSVGDMVCTKMDAAKGMPDRLAKQGLLINNLL